MCTLDIPRSLCEVRDAWLSDEDNRPAAILGARAVKTFILRRRDSFRSSSDINHDPGRGYDICGYYHSHANVDLYLFTDEVFTEACAGHNHQSVAAQLATKGLLHMNDERYKSKHIIYQDGAPRRLRFHAVRGKILDEEFN